MQLDIDYKVAVNEEHTVRSKTWREEVPDAEDQIWVEFWIDGVLIAHEQVWPEAAA